MSHTNNPEKGYVRNAPSLLPNNLVACGGKFIFAHKDRVCTSSEEAFREGEEAQINKVELKQRVHTLKMAKIADEQVVIFTTDDGVSVWDTMCQQCLFSARLAEGLDDPGSADGIFFRGAAVCTSSDGASQLCVGSSQGKIVVFSIDGDLSFRQTSVVEAGTSPVLALESPSPSQQCALGTELTSSCESGGFAVWSAANAAEYTQQTFVSTESMVVMMAFKEDFLAAGLSDGRVVLYDKVAWAKVFEITAHSRWLSVLAAHPTQPWLLTAAQDGTAAVWSIPDSVTGEVDLAHSCSWQNGMITGGAFCGPRGLDVVLVAYDWDEIRVHRNVAI